MLALAIPFPDISPEIFTIPVGSMEFSLRWYALAYIVGILGGWWLAVRVAETPRLWGRDAPVNRAQIDELITWIILSVVIGGRLGYVLFYEPARYLSAPQDIFKVWQGGMAFHGGILGVVIAAILFSRRHRVPLLSLSDILAIGTPLGLLLGRVANFINAELWGRPTDLPWGVIFPGRAAQNCGPEVLAGLCARHPSQLYEATLEGLVLGLVMLWLIYLRGILARPGALAGVFFTGYALARFAVEFVRVADAQFVSPDNPLGHVIQLGASGVSMGQLLSLPMLVFGLTLIVISRRSDARA